MSTVPAAKPVTSPRRGRLIAVALGVVVLAAIAFDTTVVHIGSEQDARQQAFSPDKYGDDQFARIQTFVDGKAVDAVTLGTELLADKAGAAKKYGTASSTGAIIPVKLTGTAGEGKSGIYDLTVQGLPPDIKVRVQTGPAINGTDLRDATGDIAFGSFKNQIEYQNAGSAHQQGDEEDGSRSARHVGAHRQDRRRWPAPSQLINPKNWLVTPVQAGGEMTDAPAANPDCARSSWRRATSPRSYGSIHALKGVNFDIHRGQVTTLVRRERCRQVDADEDPLRRRQRRPRARSSSTASRCASPRPRRRATAASRSSTRSSAWRRTSASATTSSWAARSAPRPASTSPRRSARARALMHELEEDIDPLTPVEDLRLGQQQIVEIARALSVNSRILIMDEPTSALSARPRWRCCSR